MITAIALMPHCNAPWDTGEKYSPARRQTSKAIATRPIATSKVPNAEGLNAEAGAAGEFAGKLRDGGEAAELATGGPVQMHHADKGENTDDPSCDDKAHGGLSRNLCEVG